MTQYEHELLIAVIQYQAVIRTLVEQQKELNIILHNLNEADLKEIGIVYGMKLNALTNEFITDIGKLLNKDEE